MRAISEVREKAYSMPRDYQTEVKFENEYNKSQKLLMSMRW